MSVLRQTNFLGNMRFDVPHARALESSIAADFDTIVGRGIAGDRGLVVRGFTLSNVSVGTVASNIELISADGIIYNINASESGSFLWIPADRANDQLSSSNSKVTGSFTAAAVNYVGIDFKRSADSTTTDQVQFLDANTLTETPRSVALGRTLDYVIVISSAPFSTTPNIVPIAKVTTDVNNKVSSIEDARPMLYRLASGGDFPDPQSSYSFPFGRQENNVTNTFTGGDKNIYSNKDWMDALMTRVWEIGGGENWYSPTKDINIRLVRAPSPDVFSNGENWETIGTHTHWRGLTVLFENANGTGVYYNEIADQLTDDVVNLTTQLAVGDCLYVDLDRTQNLSGVNALVMKKAALSSLGTPTVPGSRYVIAWRDQDSGTVRVFTRDYPYVSGVTILPATTTSVGGVRLNETAATPSTPTVLTIGVNNRINIGAGAYAPTGNNNALTVTGAGTGASILADGSGTGNGIIGLSGGQTSAGLTLTNVGGAFKGSTAGVHAIGVGTGWGIRAISGTGAAGSGVRGEGGVGSGAIGVAGIGDGAGAGIAGIGGDTGAGGTFVGGSTSGNGATALALAGNSHGVQGTGNGTGIGVKGIAGAATGFGVHAVGSGAGIGLKAEAGTASTGAAPTNAAVLSNGHLSLTGTNPNKDVSLTNVVTPKNIVKAWANFTLNNTVTPDFNDGFNVTSVAQTGTGGASISVTITFGGDFIGAPPNYGAWISIDGRDMFPISISKTAGAYEFEIQNSAGTPHTGTGTNGIEISAMFMGAN